LILVNTLAVRRAETVGQILEGPMSSSLLAFDTRRGPKPWRRHERRDRDPAAAGLRLTLWGLGAAAGAVLSGCAVLAPLNSSPGVPLVDAGRALALGECSACHAVGAGGGAPATGAPSFASVAERYRNYRLDWELETISQVGHYRMPAKMLTAAEVSALSAYIRTLDSAKPPGQPSGGTPPPPR